MIVPRRIGGDASSQLDGLLNAEAYRCRDHAEFKTLSESDAGKRQGVYAAILIEGSDGSRRFPLPTDFITPLPSPGAVVVPASPLESAGHELVTQSCGDAGGGDLVSRIKAAIAEKPMRFSSVAAALEVDPQSVKDAATADSGITLKAGGWLALAA